MLAQSYVGLIRGKETLIYGSRDGGHTVHADNATLNELMRRVGNTLNLREHRSNSAVPQTISGPVDIEGHIGSDGTTMVMKTIVNDNFLLV